VWSEDVNTREVENDSQGREVSQPRISQDRLTLKFPLPASRIFSFFIVSP